MHAEKRGSSAPAHPNVLLALMVSFAVLTAVGELTLQGVRKFVLHRVIHVGPDIVWMTPTTYLAIFAIPAVVMALLAWRRPGSVSLRTAITINASLCFFSVLLIGPIHKVASGVLASGLAFQLARVLQSRETALIRIANRASVRHGVPLVLGVAASITLVALGMDGWRGVKERAALEALPELSSDAPNVLLIILDTVRAASLSVYGYQRETTPRLSDFALESVVFDRAIATSPWTLPTHSSIFTGRWPAELSADWRVPLDDTYPTLAEIFTARGYATAGFVANTFYGGYEHGLNRGFIHYDDYGRSPGNFIVSTALGRTFGCWNRQGPGCRLRPFIGYYDIPDRKHAPEISGQAIDWLSANAEDPFFVFLNYFDAHVPYLPPEPFASLFGEIGERQNPMQLEREGVSWSADQVAVERLAYDAAIASLDHNVGILLDTLRTKGLLDNTIVIITSDHGEEFAEHGVMTHGNSLYLPSLHVPLLISYPARIPSGVRVPALVSVRDLAATLLDLTNVDSPTIPGTSLASHWNSGQDADTLADPAFSEVSNTGWRPDWYPVSQGDLISVVMDGYHLIRNGDGREELYDIESDYWEERDLASTDSGRRMLAHLRAALDSGYVEPFSDALQPAR